MNAKRQRKAKKRGKVRAAQQRRPTTTKKMGRPTDFKAEYCRQAELLCGLGATEKQLAEFFAVDESTITRWKQQHEEFCTSIKGARELADQRVVEALYKRACGYEKTESRMCGDLPVELEKHYPPSEVACIFWLKNRRPKEWRDKVDHAVEDANGKPMLEGLAVEIAKVLARKK